MTFYLSGLSSTQGSYTRSTLPQKTISIQETTPSFWKCRIALKSICKSAYLIQFPTPYNFANLGEYKNIIKQQNLLSRRNWLRFTVMLINWGNHHQGRYMLQRIHTGIISMLFGWLRKLRKNNNHNVVSGVINGSQKLKPESSTES